MRVQSKPFVVELKRSRKSQGQDRSFFGSVLVEAEPPLPEALPKSSGRTSAEKLFAGLVEPGGPASGERLGTETQSGPGDGKSDPTRPVAGRILPNLSWRDPVRVEEEPKRRRTKNAGGRRQRTGAVNTHAVIDPDPVTMEDFEAALKRVPASVRPEDLRRFEEFRRTHGGR